MGSQNNRGNYHAGRSCPPTTIRPGSSTIGYVARRSAEALRMGRGATLPDLWERRMPLA